MPIANFRKDVTRLESDGLLGKVSKGLFLIGDSELPKQIHGQYMFLGLMAKPK